MVAVKIVLPFASSHDPSRETAGKIYCDLQSSAAAKEKVEIGEFGRELLKSLADDINRQLATCDTTYTRPYYLACIEKKDLQMKRSFVRHFKAFSYCPFPEANTLVYKKDPATQELWFCWQIPHWSEMVDVEMNPHDHPAKMVETVKAFKASDFRPFGFVRFGKYEWRHNPDFQFERVPQS